MKKSRILIIDDFASMRKILSTYLNKLGYLYAFGEIRVDLEKAINLS